MLKRHLLLLLVLSLMVFSLPVFAINNDVAESRELTIYSRDLAEISEVRLVTLEKGDGQIILPKIASGILPGSIQLIADGISTTAISYSQDLLDETKYWNAKVGQEVEFFLKDDSVATKGILRQVDAKNLTLESLDSHGEFSLVKRSDIKDSAFTLFENAPVLEPSIIWTYSSKKRQDVKIKLSYMTDQLTWKGEHKVNLSNGKSDLTARVVITNTTNQNLSYDKITLIGGAIHLANDRRRVDRLNPTPGAENSDNISSFGDLKRWTINEPGTLASAQTSVLTILEEENTPYTKTYVYDATIFDDRITSHLEITPGKAVPAGKVRVYEKIGKEAFFVGEDKIDDTPAGSEMDLTMNQVFDLTAERIRMSETRTEEGGTSQVYHVLIGNSRNEAVMVQVLERVFGDWSIKDATLEGNPLNHTVKNARIAEFDINVPSGKTVKLSYEIRYAR